MTWTRLMSLSLTLVLTTAASAASGPEDTSSKRALVRELLEVTQVKELGPALVDTFLANFNQQFRANMLEGLGDGVVSNDAELQKEIEQHVIQSFDRFSEKFRERFPERIDVAQALEDISYPMYDQFFTAAELRDLIAFYRTPTGRKTIEVMPQVMAVSMQRSAAILNPKIAALADEILAEERRELLAKGAAASAEQSHAGHEHD